MSQDRPSSRKRIITRSRGRVATGEQREPEEDVARVALLLLAAVITLGAILWVGFLSALVIAGCFGGAAAIAQKRGRWASALTAIGGQALLSVVQLIVFVVQGRGNELFAALCLANVVLLGAIYLWFTLRPHILSALVAGGFELLNLALAGIGLLEAPLGSPLQAALVFHVVVSGAAVFFVATGYFGKDVPARQPLSATRTRRARKPAPRDSGGTFMPV